MHGPYTQACTHHNTQLCACMHCTHMSTHHSTHTTTHMCAHTLLYAHAHTTIYTHSIAHMPPYTYMHANSTAHNRARAHMPPYTHHCTHAASTYTPLHAHAHAPGVAGPGRNHTGNTGTGAQVAAVQRGRTPGEAEGAGPGLRALTLGDSLRNPPVGTCRAGPPGDPQSPKHLPQTRKVPSSPCSGH